MTTMMSPVNESPGEVEEVGGSPVPAPSHSWKYKYEQKYKYLDKYKYK